ncbi:hypothetical protein RG959_08310 [Domibacillus sp. 8LH]|uniref:hypothetical protein n=1 Tax=Domibacillus sp. 8LH TaxID=3073900 RepID=UPI00317502F3
MKKEFTLAELVKKYGTKAQKASLKKNKGNLTGKEFTILLKSVDQEWESYTVEGRGSKRIITCRGKRSRKIERIDKRSNNGQGQLAGEYELNSLVVSFLVQNHNNVKPMSATKWLTELDIIDRKLTRAVYGAKDTHLEKLQEQFSKVIKGYNKLDSDIEMLEEFLHISLKSMKSSLVSVFNKLDKAKIIIYQKERWGCTTKNSYRKLTRNEVKEIASIRQILLNAYGLKSSDLFKTNKKEVKDFKKEFDKQLNEQLGLKFDYDAHFCVLQGSDLGIQEYLGRLQEKGELEFAHRLDELQTMITIEKLKDEHSRRSLELAKGRQQNKHNISDSHRVKCIKILNQYVPMWEQLLRYFGCVSNMKSNPVAREVKEPIVFDLGGIKIEIPEESKKTNPLALFEGIRFMNEVYSSK